jgi:hypothetical protein
VVLDPSGPAARILKFSAGIPIRRSCGAIAQLGERLNGIQEVRGSTPLGSTNSPKTKFVRSFATLARWRGLHAVNTSKDVFRS